MRDFGFANGVEILAVLGFVEFAVNKFKTPVVLRGKGAKYVVATSVFAATQFVAPIPNCRNVKIRQQSTDIQPKEQNARRVEYPIFCKPQIFEDLGQVLPIGGNFVSFLKKSFSP